MAESAPLIGDVCHATRLARVRGRRAMLPGGTSIGHLYFLSGVYDNACSVSHRGGVRDSDPTRLRREWFGTAELRSPWLLRPHLAHSCGRPPGSLSGRSLRSADSRSLPSAVACSPSSFNCWQRC